MANGTVWNVEGGFADGWNKHPNHVERDGANWQFSNCLIADQSDCQYSSFADTAHRTSSASLERIT